MRVQYVHSACVVVEHRGIKVLCDPWLLPGAYYGAWHMNPALTVTPEDFHDVDFIYLSHIHQDHAHLETLKRLKKGTPVLLAPYAEPFLKQMVEGRGFPVTVCEPGRVLDLGHDFSIEIIAADDCNPERCGAWIGCPLPNLKGSQQVDSLAVFRGGGKVVLNTNDCPFPLVEPILKGLPRPDFLLVGYAGAGPYPQCFPDLSHEEKLRAAVAKQDRFLGMMRDYVTALKPEAFLPFAGQYVLGGRLAALNPYRGVPRLEEVPWESGMIKLNRMAWWDVGRFHGDPFQPLQEDGKVSAALPTMPLHYEQWDSLHQDPDSELLHEARDICHARWQNRGLDHDWYISIQWEDAAGIPRFYSLNGSTSDRHIAITLDRRLLLWLLRRKAHWNAAEIGSHLQFRRTPDVYDRLPYLALSYFHI